MTKTQLVALLVVAAVAGLTAIYYRDRERDRRRRGDFFAGCLPLFESYRITGSAFGFGVLSGIYRGRRVELEPVVDHVAFRKLPSLWLKVTVRAPVGYAGIFDLVMRPRGVEFYSPFSELGCEIAIPADWPRDAIVHADDPARIPPMDVIAPHVRIFADGRMKELLVTPRGVRLVYQVSQAERTHYVVLRQIEFGEERASPDIVRHLLDAAIDVHASVAHAA